MGAMAISSTVGNVSASDHTPFRTAILTVGPLRVIASD